MLERLIAGGLLVLSLAQCSPKTEPLPYTAASQEAVKATLAGVENLFHYLMPDPLADRYGHEAADLARAAVANGKKLKQDPRARDAAEERVSAAYPNFRLPVLFGFFDDDREVENLAMLYSARQKVLHRKPQAYLPLTFIASALAAEGYSLDVDHKYSVDLFGFSNFGLDNFASDFRNLAAQGYLDRSFKDRFTLREAKNEKNTLVSSAVFADKEAAYEAFVATLAHRQDMFRRRLAHFGLDPQQITPEEELFFTYSGYNCRRQQAFGILQQRSLEKVHEYFNDGTPKGCKLNARRVVAGHLWLQEAGALGKD